MSLAERTARNVYKEYNLGELSEDVKKQLMVFFIMGYPEVEDEEETSSATIPFEVLRNRAERSYQEAVNGEGKPIDELFDEMSSKYSWL